MGPTFCIKVRYCIYWENMPFIPSSVPKITIVNGALSWQNDEMWQSRTGLTFWRMTVCKLF